MIKLRNILLEYEYRSEIDTLVKDFFQNFTSKKNWRWRPSEFSIDPPSDEYDETEQDVVIDIRVKRDPELEWAFDFDCAKDEKDKIVGTITINPKQFVEGKTLSPLSVKDAKVELESELRDMLRHELEHVAQDAFEGKTVKYVSRDPRDSRYYVGYLLQANEIPAYLRGFETVVEHTGKSLEQVMETWYKNNRKNFKKDSYWKIVKGIWLKYAKRMKIKGLEETIKKVETVWVHTQVNQPHKNS
jgi:hypothetical protein